ncbi:hypothetical protein A3J15_01765 [Candidatus Roizmanbacteria bacterium RIFCSPLOWO2_02_FULL_38_10]|uniref:ParB/Spo0J HTH domain-containing protein n=1 Tax=Candidatus Roizmanbacteria bacterium RIFCSPLOWO2_02_FULL_38_10 TaxID=1802074 RepID=A0A1F7JN23_9BACT|nr:MAG: hypothetical protein A3J15_01765 [Candidatus Roizmanbacteria bacterium RIFCSPLOWO2_02_FULL_38_10]
MDDAVQEIKITIDSIKSETNILEKARLLDLLKQGNNLRIKELANLLSESPSKICQILRLIGLPDIIREGYLSKTISATHLIILSRIKDETTLIAIYEKILADNLSTLRTEDLVRQHIYQVSPNGLKVPGVITETIISSLKNQVPDAEIEINQTRIKATINIILKGDLKKTTQALTKIKDFLVK